MPGFNGTGPFGGGPGTGRGRGNCFNQAGRGAGWGCRGGGLRLRRKYRGGQDTRQPFARDTGYGGFLPANAGASQTDELSYLENEARLLREDLKNMEEKISQIRTDEKK